MPAPLIDPPMPVALTAGIHGTTGGLEIKYESDSLTHPQSILEVRTDDTATFSMAHFDGYSVDASTVEGSAWSPIEEIVLSEPFSSSEEGGTEFEIEATATDSANNSKTVKFHIRVRPITIHPEP